MAGETVGLKALLGRKVGMTSIFDGAGRQVLVTVIQAGPCVVVQRRLPKLDGYSAVQMGYEEVPSRKVNKPMMGHFKKAGVVAYRHLQEFRVPEQAEINVGDRTTVQAFNVGDEVKVQGISKGRGFAGVMKRWGFSGQRDSHGSKFHRRPASQGAQNPQHVFKGKRGPGRMGGKRVTVKRLEVAGIDAERNLLLIKGSVPGPNGGLVKIEAEE